MLGFVFRQRWCGAGIFVGRTEMRDQGMKYPIDFLVIGFAVLAGSIAQGAFIDESILFQHPFSCWVMSDDAGMEPVEAALLVDESVFPKPLEDIINDHSDCLGTDTLSAVFRQ